MDGVARPVSSGRTIPALLAARAAEWPEHGFIWLQDGEGRESRLDYGGLPGRVASIAAGLTERAGKGDRVLILLPPGLDYTLAVLATMAAGMIAVPVYPPDPANRMMGLAQVKAVVMDSAPSLGLTAIPVAGLVTAAGEIEPAIAALPWLHLDELEATHAGAVPNTDVSAGDVAVLLYTSGSTGAPKGVMLSHGNLADTAAAMAEDCRLDPAGRICAWLPGYHVSGLFGGIILPLWAGATVIGFAPRAFAERPIRWLEVISRYAVTFSGAPTFAYDVIARTIRPDDLAGIDLSHWATAVVGGEAIRPDVIAAFVRALAPAGFRREAIYTMFGQTEAAMITTGNGYLAGPRRLVLDPDSLREGRARDVADDRLGARELLSSGRALPGMAFAIVDSLTGIALADESVGEIWLAGPCVGLGYWGKPDDTRDIFQAFTAAREGPFLRSGDLGFRSGGEVFVVGRMKEVIILRGLKYYPDDLEATARAADERLSNAAAAAFGFEGPSGQEMLALAFEAVPIEDDAERQALASAIRRAVAASWAVQVSAIVFCAPGELPRTRTAKVQRTQCTSLLEKGAWHPVGGLLGVTGAAVAEAPQADLDALPLAEFADVLPGELARLFARRLGIRQDQMAPQHAIGDFGVDSMAVVQLGLDILNRFRVNLSAEDLRGEQTIAALSATILERRSKAAAKTSARTQDRRLRSVILGLCRRVTRTEISGLNNLPARGPAILAVNHVNSLDAPLLAGILPQERPLLIASAHLAARAFTDRPLRALFRPIYIDMNLALSFISALEALQQGEIVGIAPEGRLAIDGVLGEAKHGAAYLAAVSGAPVIPIAISGHVGWKRRLLSLKPLAVRIAFGRPMRFSGTGAGDLARNTEAIMHEIAAMLPAPYRGRYATPAFTPARHEVA